MSHFLMGVSDDFVEDCHSTMLHDNMNISFSMVYAQQVEGTRLRIKSRKASKAKDYETGYSKGRLDIQEKPRFKKRFSSEDPTNFHKAHDDRVSNPKSQKRRGTSSQSKKPTCGKCCNKHYGDCLVREQLLWVWKESQQYQGLTKF